MRKRIKFKGVWYKPVPWVKPSNCDGCAMQSKTQQCFNDVSHLEPCSSEGEFEGKVFIHFGKEALAEYIAKRLAG